MKRFADHGTLESLGSPGWPKSISDQTRGPIVREVRKTPRIAMPVLRESSNSTRLKQPLETFYDKLQVT